MILIIILIINHLFKIKVQLTITNFTISNVLSQGGILFNVLYY